jgi:peptidoglycan/LPS O-acetylase OafA/YrhL
MILHFCLHSEMQQTTTSWVDLQFLRVTGSGWIGVDLFFVLSGFLITGILWSTREKDGYFRVFYGRRFLRIFPLYYGYLAVRLTILPFFFPELAVPREGQILFWSYLSNVLPILQNVSATYSEIGRPTGLYHFWSLAVEEQFYLFWPLIVWKLNRRHLMFLCGALALGSPVLRLWLRSAFEPEAGYTFARFDALAIGSFCALAVHGGQIDLLRRFVRPVLFICIPLIVGIFLVRGRLFSSDMIMQGLGYSAVALTGAALLVRSLDRPGIFGWKWLQWLGGLCYGLYVFNGPLGHILGKLLPVSTFPAVFGSYLPAQIITLTIGIGLNIAVAWVVWHGFEKYFNNLKVRFKHGPSRARVAAPAPALIPNAD